MSDSSNSWIQIASAIDGGNDYVLQVEAPAVAGTPVVLSTPGTNGGSRCLWQFTSDGRILSQLMGQLVLGANSDGTLVVVPYDTSPTPDPTQLWDAGGTNTSNVIQLRNRNLQLYMVPQGGESGPFTPSGGLTVLCAPGTGVDAGNISYGWEQVPGTPPTIPARFSQFLGHGIPFDISKLGYCANTAVQLQFLPEIPDVTPTAEAIPPANASNRKRFESAEHTFLGGSVSLQYPDGTTVSGATQCFQTAAGRTLSYGQITALAGDFYGVPDQPVCMYGAPAFLAGFSLLWNATTELDRLLITMGRESYAIYEKYLKGGSTAEEYGDIGSNLENEYANITAGQEPRVPLLRPFHWQDFLHAVLYGSRFLKLAQNNVDHFGINAYRAYSVAHMWACRMAKQANGDASQLPLAYAMNAFADHYLSDLFSAGHLRVPRVQLGSENKLLAEQLNLADPTAAQFNSNVGNLVFKTTAVGGLLAKLMHDEDSHWGLLVRNQKGQSWRCFGDGRYLDNVNSVNRSIAATALQASADEVYAAFKGTLPKVPAALAYTPILSDFDDPVNGPASKLNFPGLYVWLDGQLQRRTPDNDLNSRKWMTKWVYSSGWGFYGVYKGRTTPTYYLLGSSAAPTFSLISINQSSTIWKPGDKVRYAFAYRNGLMETDMSPWAEWQTIPDGMGGATVSMPVATVPVSGYPIQYYVVYRQFSSARQPGPIEGIALIKYAKAALTFNDTTP
ncbi:hypothetical protein [Paucibacter sp. DJ2R-2]|uniref:hypothetical protein n=1 Tax=Paucibacter sp. DJ2R-2 TaxID=2893558 RepID=UPI0021E3EC88|nr:hypothetical protein [Paucibacter sp. DJ2R-2]MCV2420988.1 hypothetical protein [Paucibacter sp. DJ4R-1]MCV2438966.1 hypothetical protein [Paucibacter sp. DJ2R-2]